jgi:hypothetical protein
MPGERIREASVPGLRPRSSTAPLGPDILRCARWSAATTLSRSRCFRSLEGSSRLKSLTPGSPEHPRKRTPIWNTRTPDRVSATRPRPESVRIRLPSAAREHRLANRTVQKFRILVDKRPERSGHARLRPPIHFDGKCASPWQQLHKGWRLSPRSQVSATKRHEILHVRIAMGINIRSTFFIRYHRFPDH